MARPKKKIRKAAPKSRKVAPKAVKRKKAASKVAKPAVAVKAAKTAGAEEKAAKPIGRRVAEVVTAATRATVDLESAAGRIERAAVRKVGEVAARAKQAVAQPWRLRRSSRATTNCRYGRARRRARHGACSATTTKSERSTC